MSRPQREPDRRTATAIRFRPEIHEGLLAAAAERELSVNWLVNRACAEFLSRLIPPDEIQWTREAPAARASQSTEETSDG
jgi:hypothetical protein